MIEKNIPILYEDDFVLVINKPAGIAVHGDGRSDEYTIADWVATRYPESIEVGEPALYLGKKIMRPGITGRTKILLALCDRENTGSVHFSKTISGANNKENLSRSCAAPWKGRGG
jgi:23S rRNA-/tRNA-specific pseudouridylate synthase